MKIQISQKAKSVFFNLAQAAMIGGFAVMLIASMHPSARSHMRGLLTQDHRTIVSTATGKLGGSSTEFTVVKVKSRNALSLEVYENKADGSSRLVEKIEMPDKKDGYFNFNGQATNLAIADIDSDGKPEILAPSFDQNLVGRINIYQYNAEANSFQRILR